MFTVCGVDEPLGLLAATYARYWITFLVFSVFPAPDSPVHRILWSSRSAKEQHSLQWQPKVVGVYSQALGFASRDIRQVCTGSHCCWAPSSRRSGAQDSLIRSVNKQAVLGEGVRMGLNRYEGGGHKAQNIKESFLTITIDRIVVIIHFQFWDLHIFIIETIIFFKQTVYTIFLQTQSIQNIYLVGGDLFILIRTSAATLKTTVLIFNFYN